MILGEEQDLIIKLIKSEVVPAIGCTEPIAVALCVAKACELAGSTPDRIEAYLSANIIKNAMGVGIPGTGMIGLPIAIALGALKGKSEYGLEVLKDVDDAALQNGKKYVEEKRISIYHKKDIQEKLYIEIKCIYNTGLKTTAIISGSHTNFIYLHDGINTVMDIISNETLDMVTDDCKLTFSKLYDFSMETPIDKLRFILEAAKLNMAASEHSFSTNYGHSLGNIIKGKIGRDLLGDNLFADIVSATAGACDARMGGAMITVMSNSGSGNQGISATMPVIKYAKEKSIDQEKTIRALILSHLTVIYIKQKLGRLSALCGCVVAATGSSCGITYLMGGKYEHITYAVQNMIANLTGMICDGAKPSCALKVTSGVSTALYAAMMAMENTRVSSMEGIIDEDVDKSIDNLSRIGIKAMAHADDEILSIMLSK